MLFNSYVFLFAFLPAVFFLFLLTPRQALRVALLTAASYVFYAYAGWWFMALMATSTSISFVVGLLLVRPEFTRQRKRILALGIAGVVALLGYFKYAHFAAHGALSVVTVVT